MSLQLDSLRAYVAARPAPRGAGVRAGAAGGPTILVVGSGKGGAGTSVVAAMLALSAAALERRVLLVDPDEHVGPQRYLLGVTPAHTLAELRAGLAPEALLVPVSATLTLLPGGPAPSGETAALAPAERRALLRRAAACYADHDLVVVDAGSRLDDVRGNVDAALATGEHAHVRLLVVTGTDPIALAASYALVKSVAARDAISPAPLDVDVLVNRVDADAARLAFDHLDQASRHFLQHPLRLAGSMPDDASLAVALRGGMPLQDAAVGSPAAVAIQPIAARLADTPASAASAARGGRPAAPTLPAHASLHGARGAHGSAAHLAYSGSSLGSAR